jgi:acyl carrier protein
MTKNEFIEKVKEILLIEGEIGESSFIKIDSLASLLLIGFFDEYFHFKLSSHVLKQVNTIEDLAELVKEHLH